MKQQTFLIKTKSVTSFPCFLSSMAESTTEVKKNSPTSLFDNVIVKRFFRNGNITKNNKTKNKDYKTV